MEQDTISSQFLIQAIKGTNRFYVYDILKKIRAEHLLMDDDKFPQTSMGSVHLSNSLILAGGRSYPSCHKEVYRLYENGDYDYLPDMRSMKAGMGLAALKDGQIIVCVGGQTIIQGNINQVQKLVKFKKWKDLPAIPGKRLEGRAAVGIDPRFVYTFGGRPFDSDSSIMCLDLQKGKWLAYKELAFKRRFYDGAAYLEERNMIIVFGSSEGERSHQIKMIKKKDYEIELVHRSQRSFPFSSQSFISWKVFNGDLYSFDIGRENIFKYNAISQEWIMEDPE